MKKNFVDIIIYFALYSFSGWIIETIYNSIDRKEFVNRGFLNGPFCPIYGFGAILIIQAFIFLNNNFHFISDNIFIKIFVAMLLTTILEYNTGYILEKLFNYRWWDYSDFFLNLHGRICLKYSIYWGILSYIFITFIHPVIMKYISFVSTQKKVIISIFIILYFIFDTIKSVTEIINLKEVVLQQYKSVHCVTSIVKLHNIKGFFKNFLN
ncbi:putative ABC transporter permease [Defluviitalea phaphyphila]|uniref:putative ABC transporter permease n=1 Tax=Defluviitalea phaphyphila TaxID=1473580 RepID=UPI000730062F|nr:putative ABC transporter permease [Defluviitalea phaphyphila]